MEDIKNILSKHLGVKKLTQPSFKKAIAYYNNRLSDDDKKRINHRIAHYVIKTVMALKGEKKRENTGKISLLPRTNVLAINHAGPLDVTIEWKSDPDGELKLIACHIDAGGDQVNVSKVFHSFGENIALVALAGKRSEKITDEWERNFLNRSIIPSLIRAFKEDQQVAVYNIVDGEHLPAMFEWHDALSKKTAAKINRETLKTLDRMFKGKKRDIWMVLTAGGPIRCNKNFAHYASLVKKVKNKYQENVQFLIDFKYVSCPEEAMSVLDIPRETPQDIIKPNLEEFIQILFSSGLAKKGSLDENTISEKDIKHYALKLRKKYNLLGVLVSMGKAGLSLVMKDRIVREKGVKIRLASHTAAGDSLKAGFLYALSKGKSFEEAVHTGNLFGASTASMEGSQTVTPQILTKIEALARAQNVRPIVEYLASEN